MTTSDSGKQEPERDADKERRQDRVEKIRRIFGEALLLGVFLFIEVFDVWPRNHSIALAAGVLGVSGCSLPTPQFCRVELVRPFWRTFELLQRGGVGWVKDRSPHGPLRHSVICSRADQGFEMTTLGHERSRRDVRTESALPLISGLLSGTARAYEKCHF
jgi:hypothetical protein